MSAESMLPQYDELIRFSWHPALTAPCGAGEPEMPSYTDSAANQARAPGATTIVAIPHRPTAADTQNLEDIELLDAYISKAASLYMYRNNPQGWNLGEPASAADFTQKLANAKFLVITRGLGAVLSNQGSTSASFDKSTTWTDLHMDFLEGLFGGFGFGDTATRQLDGILTRVAASLRNLQAGWSGSSQAIDHLICFHSLEKEEGIEARLPRLRVLYLHIDPSSWTAAVGKSPVDHFKFSMGYDDTLFVMTNQVARTRQQLRAYLTQSSGMALADTVKLARPRAIDDDRQDA